jgi:serine phosphatase RsbU (regulator of sigma subunit)
VLRVDTFYHPAHTIGGDFGLVRPLKEDHLNLLVCDVSGHGISLRPPRRRLLGVHTRSRPERL